MDSRAFARVFDDHPFLLSAMASLRSALKAPGFLLDNICIGYA
jgi:hypothetical protein